MTLRCKGHLFHKWVEWSKPFRQKYHYFGLGGRHMGDAWELEQSRECQRCHRVQTREVF